MNSAGIVWRWVERLAPWIAILGVLASMVPDYRQARQSPDVGFDFRVVYTAVDLMRHGQNPYDPTLLPAEYRRAGFPVPPKFLGRAPVYPPPTLLLLYPLTWTYGIRAEWMWVLLSAVLFAAALARLTAWSGWALGLTPGYNILLVALCASSSTLGFEYFIGNVSLAVAALCVLAYCDESGQPGLAGLCLAIACVLKPHLAVWVVVALLVAGRPHQRRAAWAGALGAIGFAVLTAVWLGVTGHLRTDLGGYIVLLRTEQASGSMAPGFLQPLPVAAQITALGHLVAVLPLRMFTKVGLRVALLVGLAGIIGAGMMRARRRAGGWTEESRLLLTGALIGFGMLASYHRDHDALVLVLILPVFLAALRSRAWNVWIGLALVGLLVMNVEITTHYRPIVRISTLRVLVFYRQAAIGALALTVGCAVAVLAANKKDGMNGEPLMPGGQ